MPSAHGYVEIDRQGEPKKGPLRMVRGLISNKVHRLDLHPGDHIYSWRGLLYAHHGIYTEDGKVIHFGRGAGPKMISSKPIQANCEECSLHNLQVDGVTKSCLDCFLKEGKLYRYKYGVSTLFFICKITAGTCTRAKCDPPETVLCRAKYLLKHNGFGGYDLLNHNCEDFALYCKTGKLVFTMGGSGQAAGAFCGLATIFSPFIRCLFDINKGGYEIPVEDLPSLLALSDEKLQESLQRDKIKKN